MKKIVALILTLAMTLSLFACTSEPANSTGSTAGGSSESSKASSEGASQADTGDTGEAVEFLFVVPGEAPKDLEGGLAEINKKLEADGVGVKLNFNFIPWDAWDQKINLMLSTGEKFDAFQVMNDRVTLTNYAARGALADLTDLMDQYGTNIMNPDINPESMIKSVSVKDQIYAIPAYWIETALDPEITLRKDILEKYNLEVPTTWDELTAAFETVMTEWDGATKPYYPSEAMVNFGLAQKTYDEWPFVIYDQIFCVDQEGNVQNIYETDIFKQNSYKAREWYEKGLISPDVLTTTSDQKGNQLDSGDWFIHGGTIGSITKLQPNYPDLTTDDFINLDLAPDKPRVRPYGTRNMNAVPLASEHPEAAVKFFNWILEDQENYDLFMYGREGVDYELTGERTYNPIIDPVTNQQPYFFSDWMAGNINSIRFSDTAPKATVDALYTINEEAVEGYAAMFTFDASNVQTQLADVKTQIDAVIKPIASGVRDYDSNIEEALNLLKVAGIDDLVEEFKTQLEESKK